MHDQSIQSQKSGLNNQKLQTKDHLNYQRWPQWSKYQQQAANEDQLIKQKPLQRSLNESTKKKATVQSYNTNQFEKSSKM